MPKKGNRLHSATDLFKYTKPAEYQRVLFLGVAYWVAGSLHVLELNTNMSGSHIYSYL